MVKAAISAVPVAGGPAAELFSAIITPPLVRRRDRWVEEIAEAVEELQQRVEGLTPETLSQNDKFVSTLLHASQVASRNHQKEKLEALRNAVMNAALPKSPDDDTQQMFLNYVDDLTPWHLKVLALFNDPAAWGKEHGIRYPSWSAGGPSSVLEHSFPELQGKREFYDQLTRDLDTRGLLRADGIHTTMTAHGMFASRTTDFGKAFLRFVSKPF